MVAKIGHRGFGRNAKPTYNRNAFRLVLKYQYGNKEALCHTDILYIKNLNKVKCNTIYILDIVWI